MNFRVFSLALSFFALPFLATTSHAQTPDWNVLDDEAEAGGYDLSAQIKAFPAQIALNRGENGDGYLVKMDGKTLVLSLIQNKKSRVLATTARKTALPATFVAQRRGARWRFLLNGQTALEAENSAFSDGEIATLGAWSGARVQPVENIAFDDDFMRVASEVALREAIQNPRAGVKIRDAALTESIWSAVAGKWATTGLTENVEAQVAQSANPFAFRALERGENFTLAGRPFWNDYSAQISALPSGATQIGLLVYVQDAKNYLGFFWGDKTDPQLRAVVNGQSRVLAQAKNFGPYEAKQWVRLGVSISSGTLRAFVDDAEIMRATTGLFARGQIGLLANLPRAGDDKTGEGVAFDDARVRSINDFYDAFHAPVAGRWQNVVGAWKFGNGQATPADARGAYAVMGERDWDEYEVSGRLSVPQNGAAGLLLHHQSSVGAYLLRVGGANSPVAAGKIQLARIAGGKTLILAETSGAGRASGFWTFQSERGYLSATRDGERVLDAFDANLGSGRAGIFAQNGGAISEFGVEWPQKRATWAKIPELFVADQQTPSMGSWSTPQGFWSAKTGAGSTLEHKGRFFGGQSVRFPLPDLKDEKTARLEIGTNTTVVFGAAQMSIEKAGKTLEIQKIALAKGTPVEIERRGTFVIVRAGKDAVLAARL